MQNADEPKDELPSGSTGESHDEFPMTCHPAQFPAYILCGGQSVRFGTNKARVRIDRQPHLLRLAKTLRTQGHETHFVADSADRYKDLGIATIVDVQPNCGPMAGLISAAKHRAYYHGSGWFLLLGCDQLRWRPEYFRRLADRVRADLAAVTYCAPLSSLGILPGTDSLRLIQPIPGLYHTRIQALAEAALAVQQLSLKRMLEISNVVVSIEETENPWDWCFNSVGELKALLDKLQREFGL